MEMDMVSYSLKRDLWKDMEKEIEGIVSDMQSELQDFANEVLDLELLSIMGNTAIPLKLNPSAFIGSSGTGKSTFAKVLGKGYFVAGSLPSDGFVEIKFQEKISDDKIQSASGGVLLVNVDKDGDIEHSILRALITIIDRGITLVIIEGEATLVDKLLQSNDELNCRISNRRSFRCFGHEEIIKILRYEVDNTVETKSRRLRWDEACTDEHVKNLVVTIKEETIAEHNGYVAERIYLEILKNLGVRTKDLNVDDEAKYTVTLADLEAAINTTIGYCDESAPPGTSSKKRLRRF